MSVRPNTAASLCWTRRRYGNGFQYRDDKGNKITTPAILKRLRALAIPPNWREVLICQDVEGKVQAVGRDAKGRKQYIYHPDWEKKRQKAKFARLPSFGAALPQLRKECYAALDRRGWNREKVIAMMVLVLDETGIRIGNRQYLDQNETYGLTTLRRRHLDVEDERLLFHFQGKSGKQREVEIEDPELIPFIRRAAEMPGYEIFRYQEGSHWENLDSEDINAFIRKWIGDEYSSKFFRTWVANRTAVEILPEAHELKDKGDRRKLDNISVRMVADALGNTPSVCRNYYLHPKVLRIMGKKQLPDLPRDGKRDKWEHDPAEIQLLKWIS